MEEWEGRGGDGITLMGWAIIGRKMVTVVLVLKSGASPGARDNAQRMLLRKLPSSVISSYG
jgi:hypothetical protein